MFPGCRLPGYRPQALYLEQIRSYLFDASAFIFGPLVGGLGVVESSLSLLSVFSVKPFTFENSNFRRERSERISTQFVHF